MKVARLSALRTPRKMFGTYLCLSLRRTTDMRQYNLIFMKSFDRSLVFKGRMQDISVFLKKGELRNERHGGLVSFSVYCDLFHVLIDSLYRILHVFYGGLWVVM
jgi:hypothetical protein